MTKAIIFDCFGVIYPDTLALVLRSFLKTKDTAKRLEVRNLRQQSDLGIISREDFWNGTAQILGISRQELNSDLAKFQNADWELLEYIKNLKRKYKTALLSNVGKGFLERIFDERQPSQNYFDEIIASGELGFLKPDPKIFEHTVMKLKVKSAECVLVDDKQMHIDGARNFGMKAILYEDLEQMKIDLENLLTDSNR